MYEQLLIFPYFYRSLSLCSFTVVLKKAFYFYYSCKINLKTLHISLDNLTKGDTEIICFISHIKICIMQLTW